MGQVWADSKTRYNDGRPQEDSESILEEGTISSPAVTFSIHSFRRWCGGAPGKGQLLQGTANLKDTALNPSIAFTKSAARFMLPNTLVRLGAVPIHPFTSPTFFFFLCGMWHRGQPHKNVTGEAFIASCKLGGEYMW